MHDESRGNPSLTVIEGSVSGAVVSQAPGSGLTEQQLRFAQAFVENGGKSGEAALAAGYGHDTYGHRLLAKKKVQDEIAKRVKLQAGSALAIAMGGLLRIIEHGEDERAVVAASLGLMDRFGMAVPKGPLIDARSVNVTGPAASGVLQMIADRIAARGGA